MDEGQINKFHKACRTIIENKDLKSLNYAVRYALQGLTLTTEYEVKSQIPYILFNIVYWRGPIAKKTRKTLKSIYEGDK